CIGYNKEHQNVHTNNYVESWHRTLKQVYLPSLRSERVDVLVWILMEQVLPDVMDDHVRTLQHFQSRRMTLAER
ncbi:hypothetical protein BC940DRAFT_214923, partial [Gongronella butleri]